MLESIQTGTTITLINNKQLSRMEVPVYSKSMMDEIGGSIKKNQTTYKEKVKDAEQQYEGKRAELMMRLGLDNSKK
jgi:type I restriction enzyme M protein